MITDKEKLEYIWRIVNEKKLWDKHQLVQIKDILEKRSLTDEQGYQEALELDEEERLVLLKKEEKLEKALEHINHFLAERDKVKGSERLPILRSDITHIKSILETGKLPDYN